MSSRFLLVGICSFNLGGILRIRIHLMSNEGNMPCPSDLVPCVQANLSVMDAWDPQCGCGDVDQL